MTIVQTQCCELFYFLIKKKLMFFTNGCPSLATRVGALLFTMEKKLKIGKVKTKNGYVQIEKIKTKKESYVQIEK